jgi:hypothetical protein
MVRRRALIAVRRDRAGKARRGCSRPPLPSHPRGLRLVLARMAPGALRDDENAGDNKQEDHARRIEPAKREAAVSARLVQEIADCRAERARQDEGRPEQSRARHVREEIQRRDDCEAGGEDERAAAIAEPGRGREKIAERGAERLRKQDR